MINHPQNFFDQVRNLCEELGLKMKSISESIASLLSKSDAESTYLKKTDAQSAYLGKTAKAESAKTADTATTATSATKATQDGNGAVISSTYLKSATASSTYLTKSDAQATYLGKDAKAQSATFADSATTATNANSALKATQDADGNVIGGTYLKKTEKAASATTADSATKATQDGNGANIANTYATKTDLNSVSTVASNADNKASQRIVMNGSRGALAGYNTPNVTASAVTINGDSNDDTYVTGSVAITVANGSASTAWTKTVSLTSSSATVTLSPAWSWANDEVPEISANSVVVLYWNNGFGIANLVKGLA